VNNRLRERVFARVEGCSVRAYHLGALATASGPASQVAGRPYVLIGLVLFLVLVAVAVLSAIWSKDPARRKDALDVLDRLLRWKGGRLRAGVIRASVARGTDIPAMSLTALGDAGEVRALLTAPLRFPVPSVARRRIHRVGYPAETPFARVDLAGVAAEADPLAG
jgi:hypothetical protein